MLYRTSSAGAHIVDGDFYDFTWRYNPYTMAIHKGGANAPYLQGKAIYGVDYGLGGPGWAVRPVNTEGIWYERSSSRQFVHRMASLESHIHASSVDARPAS
jgi:hypothetical protein